MKRRVRSINLIFVGLFVGLLIGCSQPSVSPKPTPTRLPQTTIPNIIQDEPPALTGKVVFQNSVGGKRQIFVIDLASQKVTQLTHEGENIEPSWSKDGKQIVYTCTQPDKSLDVCAMNADGSNIRNLTNTPINEWTASWSPDGSQIVFISNQVPYTHAYVLDLKDGKSRRLVTTQEGNEGTPQWSNDGKQIIYMAERGGTFNIYTNNPDGTRESKLTDFGQDARPRLSQDDKRITFRRTIYQTSMFNGTELMVMDANGKNIIQLTDNTSGNDWPVFSPDGKWILYVTNTDGTPTMVVVPSKGGSPANIVRGGLVGKFPDWIP